MDPTIIFAFLRYMSNLLVSGPDIHVMSPNPECATVDTPIIDALHTMTAGKFLHLPVVDRGDFPYISLVSFSSLPPFTNLDVYNRRIHCCCY